VVSYEYDSQNRLQKVVEGTEETSYRYDEVGNLIETIFPNGTVERREYDELYRLTNVRVVDSDDALLSEFKYELNEAGHRTQVVEKVRQPDGSLSERTVEYEYDELYRLIEAAVWGGETITYRYDEVGNRISAGARSYVYDDNDRLIEEREGGEVVVEYGYDDNGNLLSRTEGNETVNYIWDDRNRLVEVEENGERVEFEYDDDNIRVSQTVGGEKTSFLLDKNRPYDQVLAEFVDGEEVASYVYGLDLISQQRNGDDWFYFVDGLGSTRGLTDSSGEVTDAYWYDAYGNLVERVGSSENDYLFAGEQFDEELGQYYLRQRYYDATTGRFTRRDTWEGNRTNPITLNKYLYANGNPVSYIDPSGLSPTTFGIAPTALINALAALTLIGIGVTASISIAQNTSSLIELMTAFNAVLGAAAAEIMPTFIVEKDQQGQKTIVPETISHGTRRDQNWPQMRVQLQKGHSETYAIAAINTPEKGVTVKQMYKATTQLWYDYKNKEFDWLSQRYETAFIKGLANTTRRIKRYHREGGVERIGTVGTYQWLKNDPKGKKARHGVNLQSLRGFRGDYRVDLENLRNSEVNGRIEFNLRNWA